jgi:LuxR family maltose regulon positive regulatory protein
LCDAVTGTSSGKAMLEELDRSNLFLVPLDDRRRWYRYHHLFADVLRARLSDEEPEDIDELHRRASVWFEAEGDRAEAITHALSGHDVERAARLVELATPALFQARQEWTARRWLGALPDELFPDRPVLAMELVGARMVSGDISGVERLLDDIERWLRPGADRSTATVFDEEQFARLPAQVAIYRAALALIAGDPEATIAHASRALEQAGQSDHLQRGSAGALVGLAEWTTGDLDGATRHYADAIDALTAAGHISDVLGCSIALADMRLAQGRLADAQRVFESALELAQANHVVRGTADMHVGLSEVLLDRGDVDGARRHLDASTQLGEQAGLPQHPYRSRVAAGRLRLVHGDRAGAVALLDEAERLYNTDMSPPVRPVSAVKARALLRGGDLAGARRWARASGLTADDDLTYVREYEHLTLARVLLADGGPDDAIRLAERLLVAAEAGGRTGSAIEIGVVLALAHGARGDQAAARASLEQAIVMAEPEGSVRPFIDEAASLAPMLRASTRPDFARRVLGASQREPAALDREPPAALVDELSPRERDVLRLLRSDLSGPEIARELVVSLNTVRTHTKNIYVKLGVNNRREAVRRAGELGL